MHKAVFNDNYLCHYNKNHSKANGQFTSGDGDGDGIVNDQVNQRKKKGQYSAKIENYHKGNMFQEAYYIDKRGNKRSYQSIKEMPVEAQNAARARAEGKKVVKKALEIGVAIATPVLITAGTAFLINKLNNRTDNY